GGLVVGDMTNNLTLTNSTVADNQAGGGNGGLSGSGGSGVDGGNGGSAVALNGVILTGNPGNLGTGGGSNFFGTPGSANGAGINIKSPTTTALITSSTIAFNNAVSGLYTPGGLQSPNPGALKPSTGGGVNFNPHGAVIANTFNLTLISSIVAANTVADVTFSSATGVVLQDPVPSDIYGTLTTPAKSNANLIGAGGAGGLIDGQSGNQ